MISFRKWLESAAEPVVLVASGAYNPIHRGHIKVFYHAKRFLITQGYDVIAAYIIPRSYHYIQFKSQKSGEDPISDFHRQKMIQQALQGTFIKLLPLEVNKINMSNAEMRAEVEKIHPGTKIIFVAGDDKDSCPDQQTTCLVKNKDLGDVVIVGRKLAGDASSTTVRNNLKKVGDEPNLLSPANWKYIHQNHLWNAS